MLKIFISKYTKNPYIIPQDAGDYTGILKYHNPSHKQWFNSIYTYNKKYPKLLPIWDEIIIMLIKSYFNMQNKDINEKLKTRYLKYRWRKKSPRKVWVSKAELKHTADRVIINIFIYDRNKKFMLLKTNVLYKTFIKNRIQKFFKDVKIAKSYLFTNTWKYVTNFYRKKAIEYFNILQIENNNMLSIYNSIKNNIIYKNFEIYKINFLYKTLKKEILIMFYHQMILLNNIKTKNAHIFPLVKLLTKIYKKKVIFNIVRLKYYFLNSDILTQMIVYKLKDRKYNPTRILNKVYVYTPKFNPKLIIRQLTKLKGTQNHIIENEFINTNIDYKDELNEVLNNFYKLNNYNVLDNLKYKMVMGIKLEASGRLTRRFVAQRAVYKYRYIGGIKNIDSSYRGISSTMIRNTLKSNVQFSKLSSIRRTGAFGLKGWIGGV